MGQAQLLLIVLGVVLVGVAIVAGIQAYSTNNEKANIDAQTHDIMRIASDIQSWAQKPVQFGGPATANYGDVGFAGFDKLGYLDATSATVWSSVNATYTLSAVGTGNKTISATNTELGTSVTGIVCGLDYTDILTQIGTSAPSCPTT